MKLNNCSTKIKIVERIYPV